MQKNIAINGRLFKLLDDQCVIDESREYRPRGTIIEFPAHWKYTRKEKYKVEVELEDFKNDLDFITEGRIFFIPGYDPFEGFIRGLVARHDDGAGSVSFVIDNPSKSKTWIVEDPNGY